MVVDALNLNTALDDQGHFTWTTIVKQILVTTGFPEVWAQKSTPNLTTFIGNLKINLKKQHCSLTQEAMTNDVRKCPKEKNKLRTYRLIKSDHNQAKYLSIVKDPHIRSSIAKLRLSCHSLMIERGRHMRLPLEARTCTKCTLHEIEDEFHAVMRCAAYKEERTSLFNTLAGVSKSWEHLSEKDKFAATMNIEIQPILVGKYINHIITFEHQPHT